MDEMLSYTQIAEAKNGSLIPLRGKTAFHSKYNPERESQSYPTQFTDGSLFFVILGIAGGYHIQSLKEKFPDAKIIAVENSRQDIDFLKKIPAVKKLSDDSRVVFTDFSALKSILISSYIPSLHKNIFIASLRAWADSFPEQHKKAMEIINQSLKEIGADFSVQKHFGKIWQKNIFLNLSMAEKTISFYEAASGINLSKTVAVIAAGPSLNESVKKFEQNRDKYCIIATDTAYSALLERGIESDFCMTVDGQMISHAHYMHKITSRTVFVFDLCSSSSSVRKVINNGGKCLFIESGHPLSVFASRYSGTNFFEHMDTGSGTVTIAAANFAVRCGFKRIEFFGADFSYIKGLPYVRGTYLDAIYREKETKLNNAETSFTNLLYRTKTIPLSSESFTTEVLESYKKSFEAFLKSKELKKTEGNLYERKDAEIDFQEKKNALKFNFECFKETYQKELKKLFSDGLPSIEKLEDSPVFATLLPLCASESYENPFLAYTKTLRYTEKI